MNARSFFVSISISALGLALASSGAFADQGKTREQVQSELSAAQTSGDVPAGFVGKSMRELFPGNYAQTGSSGATAIDKTREDVRCELAKAQKNGEIRVSFLGRTERELLPGNYPAADASILDVALSSAPACTIN